MLLQFSCSVIQTDQTNFVQETSSSQLCSSTFPPHFLHLSPTVLQCCVLGTIVSGTGLSGHGPSGRKSSVPSPAGCCSLGRNPGAFDPCWESSAPQPSDCPSAGDVILPVRLDGMETASIAVFVERNVTGRVGVRVHSETDGRSLLVTEGTSWRVLELTGSGVGGTLDEGEVLRVVVWLEKSSGCLI